MLQLRRRQGPDSLGDLVAHFVGDRRRLARSLHMYSRVLRSTPRQWRCAAAVGVPKDSTLAPLHAASEALTAQRTERANACSSRNR